ncbi:MAG TPA: alpha-2-macroglobulin family protein [Candidatus Cybelea sp.]|nr:alpha-2-macroglobulin family protein [Candidatus Cybelea sp.]
MASARFLPLAGIRLTVAAALVAASLLGAPSSQADNEVPATTQDVVRPAGAVVVPEKFLRRWDPITVFFDQDTGPASGGPEDHPEKYFTLAPSQPGAATWINARTLQFKPAEPWPPLTRYNLTVGSRSATLATLMSAPTATTPADGATGLDPVRAIALTLPEPLDADALAKLITIELRPLPGVDAATARTLTDADFDVKVMERADRSAPGQYVIDLHDPIPGGTRALLHLKLSLESGLSAGFQDISFSTAEPFRVTALGCPKESFPIPPTGAAYGREDAIKCPAGDRSITVDFSANLAPIGPIAARNLIRISPAVDDVTYAVVNNVLSVSGKFASGTLYQVSLEPTALTDTQGRALQMPSGSTAFLSFAERESFLNWLASSAIVERYGPQMLPLKGRGFDQVDIRIHKIDPLNRSFWPFPNEPVAVDESARPPAPGEEPEPFTAPGSYISDSELSDQIKALGSPSVSDLVTLPLQNGGAAAKFGIDLRSYFTHISGADKPGTYLVGLRRIDSSSTRAWIRVQVTDLSLSAVDEADRVRFVVTSLSTGKPVEGAKVKIEGARSDKWVEAFSGTTDDEGEVDYQAPGDTPASIDVRRIVVSKDDDMLVMDPTRGPDTYADNTWRASDATWLQWTQEGLGGRAQPDADLVHIFTERPIYRPEEPVHIKGYLRHYSAGELGFEHPKAVLVITAPDNTEWRHDVTINDNGSFYEFFQEKTTATGIYKVTLELDTEDGPEQVGLVTFKKEAYRLPTFEVHLNGPDKTPSDKPFTVKLAATYYAGGVVSKRPIHWRVTQFPYDWQINKRDGFYYSTDARFSGIGEFASTPVLEKDGTTDDQGAATLDLNPAIEPSAQPRSYVIEATVTGDDDQTVTSTQQVAALPPFAIGVKVPRYLKVADSVAAEVLLQGIDDKPVADKTVTVKLLKRRWISELQASDFTEGSAKYVTETVDEPVSEQPLTSGTDPSKLDLKLTGAGVYILKVESRDALGRGQSVAVDFFADGGQPVTWSRPPAQVFKVTTEKPDYRGGDTAVLILESPFQNAEALAIVEEPDARMRYEWVHVRNGVGRFELPIKASYMPRIPVHFLLMRGRLPGAQPTPDQLDLGKPQTLAATNWVVVKPAKNLVNVKLDFPDKALPGQEITMKIALSDDTGAPLAGEVTLWLVDQAVLALADEQRLDPLPDFIVDRASRMQLRDTRNLVLGALPLEEEPGGDQGLAEKKSLFDNVTVRKNFTPVPYFNPSIMVGPDGKAEVKIKLADSLSIFKVRAKAVSGSERFGYATGSLRVRLPVMIQPNFPRFVRPGDQFTLAGLGRIIEGDGGPGRAELRADGLTLSGQPKQGFTWTTDTPVHLDFPVSVPTPQYTPEGELARRSVNVMLGVERSNDQSRDAVSIDLPIQPDRRPVDLRTLADLTADQPVTIPEITEPVRAGTLRRNVLLSSQPALLRMAAALDYLQAYPYGCTEQRISLTRAELALKKFRDTLMLGGKLDRIDRDVADTMTYITKATNDDGLVSFWPGSKGYVFLTAWSVQFLVEARDAGYTVDDALLSKQIDALTQALRSDYSNFISGIEYAERVWALTALAEAGKADDAYAAELAHKTRWLDLEALAQVTEALRQSSSTDPATLADLTTKTWAGIVTRLYQGKEIYGGLQTNAMAGNALILPSESRTVAQVLQAVATSDDEPKKQLLVNALVTLGRGDGWGTTNANAEALLALSKFIATQPASNPMIGVGSSIGGAAGTIEVGGEKPIVHLPDPGAGKLIFTVSPGVTQPIGVLAEATYVPLADGSQEAPHAEGLVVSREVQQVQSGDAPPLKTPLDAAGKTVAFKIGEIDEDHVEIVNPKDRNHVAIVIPLAAGMEPLNPALATAPPEAKPSGTLTLTPSYVAFLDDQVEYFYDTLPKGTYEFYFRTRAHIVGHFIQPAAYAEMMYDGSVNGNSSGAMIEIAPADAQ